MPVTNIALAYNTCLLHGMECTVQYQLAEATYHIQFPSWAAWNNSWSLFVILSVFRTTSSWVGRTSPLLDDVTLSAVSATTAEKSEFDGDSTASVGVMSALFVGGTLTSTLQRTTWSWWQACRRMPPTGMHACTHAHKHTHTLTHRQMDSLDIRCLRRPTRWAA